MSDVQARVTELSGVERATLIFLALDQDLAQEVLRHMSEEEVQRVLECAQGLDPAVVDAVDGTFEALESMMKSTLALHLRRAGSYLQDLAGRVLGREKVSLLLKPKEEELASLKAIKAARANTLSELLGEEHPQIAAVIVSQLPKDQAAKVVQGMSTEKKVDILTRMASLKEISPDMVAMASNALVNTLQAAGGVSGGENQEQFNGVAFVASLLNELPRDATEELMENLEEADPEVAPKIRQAMFIFEDLLRVSVRNLQTLMREVATEQILIALKTASEELREHFLSAVSSRAAQAMREDLALLPPMRISDVEQSQQEVIEIAQRLASEGRLTLPGAGGEKLV
ncbi:MAG: hypothetical protein IPK13_22490 [Deltaproteobacteria bacterium]|nr:hypothetical protein [Deltaproteobacteria bacterium]